MNCVVIMKKGQNTKRISVNNARDEAHAKELAVEALAGWTFESFEKAKEAKK